MCLCVRHGHPSCITAGAQVHACTPPSQDEGEEDEDGLALGDGAQTPDLEASAAALAGVMCSCCGWWPVQLLWLVSCAAQVQ